MDDGIGLLLPSDAVMPQGLTCPAEGSPMPPVSQSPACCICSSHDPSILTSAQGIPEPTLCCAVTRHRLLGGPQAYVCPSPLPAAEMPQVCLGPT